MAARGRKSCVKIPTGHCIAMRKISKDFDLWKEKVQAFKKVLKSRLSIQVVIAS